MINICTDIDDFNLYLNRIIFTKDLESNHCLFIFLQINGVWHQLYFDVGVIFINPIEQDIYLFLKDLDQKITDDIFFENKKATLSYNAKIKKITIKGDKFVFEGFVTNDRIILSK